MLFGFISLILAAIIFTFPRKLNHDENDKKKKLPLDNELEILNGGNVDNHLLNEPLEMNGNKLEKYEIPQKVIILKKLPRTNLGKISSSELRNYKI